MSPIEIKGFDPARLEEIANDQTKLYNFSISKLPEFEPAKAEDTIKRFKREKFDQSRMFYAYDGNRMVGYVGLTGRDKEKNQRGAGYPWLAEATDPKVREQLFEAMLKKCKAEGLKTLNYFASPRYPEQLNFFKEKGFQTKVEFLGHSKKLKKNKYKLPPGYAFRELKRADLPIVETVSKNDPKIKSPFNAADFEQFQLSSSDYDPQSYIVAEKDGTIIGYFGIYVPKDSKNEKAYFSGVSVHKDHQNIEEFMMKEMENRALARGKKRVEMSFFPDSQRKPFYQKQGYKLVEQSYELHKAL